jgi:hypothetical protein
MKEHKIIKDKFNWIPAHQRKSRFGGAVSSKVDTRKPLLWLARDGEELFLVNESNETLKLVTSKTGGFFTNDDNTYPISSDEHYLYKDIEHGVAVKLDKFDPVYDNDYIIQVNFSIISKDLGNREFATPPNKGEIGEMVILWDTGELGKHVVERNI